MAVILNGNKRSLPFYGCRCLLKNKYGHIYLLQHEGKKKYGVLSGSGVTIFDTYKEAKEYVENIVLKG